jgi:hypothetical protein
MPRKKETLTLSVPPGTRERLDAIAQRLGFFWGKSPSPSALVGAIASGDLAVAPRTAIQGAQVKALEQAVADLVDAGHLEEAKSVITLLLEQGALEAPLRQKLLTQVSQPLKGFRAEIEDLCHRRQPFRVVYKRPSGEVEDFTAHYAEILPWEKRFYLQIWAPDALEGGGIPELRYNRCLRLDRIEGIFAVSGIWRGYFDSVDVHMRLLGGLALAYEAKAEDIEDDKSREERNITRRMINLFWFVREVRRYGADCVVISPNGVREQVAADLAKSLSHYRAL